MNENNLTLVRRDTSEKLIDKISNLTNSINDTLQNIQEYLFKEALDFQKENTFQINSYTKFKKLINEGAFIECGWDGDPKTEIQIKKDTNATIRCIPFQQNIKNLNCIYSSKKAKYKVIFAKAY